MVLAAAMILAPAKWRTPSASLVRRKR